VSDVVEKPNEKPTNEPKNAVAQAPKGPTLADLAPKGIDGRLWVKTLKEQLLSSKNGEPTDAELLYFARVCQASGLDPSRKEIYGIYRNVKQKDGTYKPKLSIQTSIDGLRVTAERGGKYGGSEEPIFEYDASYKISVNNFGTDKVVPNKAKVTVLKVMNGTVIKTTRTAKWEDYYPGDREGGMWKKLPETMLAKVAEAQALRAAFPNTIASLYIEEEMQQSDVVEETGINMSSVRTAIQNARDNEEILAILRELPADQQKQAQPWAQSRMEELRG
jgi:phage recombination protein Bet